jgi:hypothetical protein
MDRINVIQLMNHEFKIDIENFMRYTKRVKLSPKSNHNVIFCNIIGCRTKTNPSSTHQLTKMVNGRSCRTHLMGQWASTIPKSKMYREIHQHMKIK